MITTTTIPYKEQPLAIRIRRRRGMRRLALSVTQDGVVSLSAPRRASIPSLESFLQRQLPWIEQMLDRVGFSLKESEEKCEKERENYERMRDLVHALVLERLEAFREHYQISWHSITIRNQRSRWGSASAAGRLSFNYRLWYLSTHLQDYVIVHELCHLRELNHSSRFWALVAETIPNYRERRRELRSLDMRTLGSMAKEV